MFSNVALAGGVVQIIPVESAAVADSIEQWITNYLPTRGHVNLCYRHVAAQRDDETTLQCGLIFQKRGIRAGKIPGFKRSLNARICRQRL